MQLFVIVSFAVIFVGEFAVDTVGGGMVARLLPEACSGVAILLVAVNLGLRKRFVMPTKYAAWMLIFAAILAASVLANQMPIGGVIVGLREYLKYLPFFLLPLVYPFSEREIMAQLKWLVLFSVVQLPVVLYQIALQKMGHTAWLPTGDFFVGTLGVSSLLSVWLISAWSVLFAFFLRKRVGMPLFLALSVLMLLPTMLNETKGSVILLPVAVMIPLLISRTLSIGAGVVASAGICLAILGYAQLSSMLFGSHYDLLGFLSDPDTVHEYLSPQSHGKRAIGRIDKVEMAWEEISQDPVTLLLGFGMGNVSPSPVSVFEGEFAHIADRALIGVGMNKFLWETGILGVLAALTLPLMVFADAWRLVDRRTRTVAGVLALGWCSVATITFLSMFYINPLYSHALSFLFWFYSGYVATNVFGAQSVAPNARLGLAPARVSSGPGIR